MTQIEKWEKEYQENQFLQSSRTYKPSRALLEFLGKYKPSPGMALDVGCGKGRNSLYLATLDWRIVAIENATSALDMAKKEASKLSAKPITFIEQSVGEDIPFPDKTFDLILDMMTMHLLDPKERENYVRNIKRLLKPDGYFVFYTIAAESPAAQKLFIDHPGPEPDSYVIPQSGMIEKAFTETDLREMFSPLAFLRLEPKTEFTPAFGDVFERVYYTGILQNTKMAGFAKSPTGRVSLNIDEIYEKD